MYQTHGVHLSPVTRHLSRRFIRANPWLILPASTTHSDSLRSDPRFIRVYPRLIFAAFIAAVLLCANTQAQSRSKHKHAHIKTEITSPSPPPATPPVGEIVGKRVKFVDGSSIQVDEVWKQGEEYWSRTGGVTQRLDRDVRVVEPVRAEQKAQVASLSPIAKNDVREALSFWIFLKDGARMKVDEVTETGAGALYRRGNLSIFIEREQITRIEREVPGSKRNGWSERGWTTGNAGIDQLIRVNGARFGVDPYLVFCVIEHESHFNVRAVSPKGARGLMQLMPGTASRFGVRRSMDPAENIFGGTQYLKLLLQMFNGRVDLALASYNAGEGAVLKYGRNVPPYRETREYVKRITKRYGGDKPGSAEKISP